jgi:hypothetical protein
VISLSLLECRKYLSGGGPICVRMADLAKEYDPSVIDQEG